MTRYNEFFEFFEDGSFEGRLHTLREQIEYEKTRQILEIDSEYDIRRHEQQREAEHASQALGALLGLLHGCSKKAARCIAQGKYNEAEEELGRAVAVGRVVDPQFNETSAPVAKVYSFLYEEKVIDLLESERFEDVLEVVSLVERKGLLTDRLYHARARAYLECQRLPQAREAISKALKECNRDPKLMAEYQVEAARIELAVAKTAVSDLKKYRRDKQPQKVIDPGLARLNESCGLVVANLVGALRWARNDPKVVANVRLVHDELLKSVSGFIKVDDTPLARFDFFTLPNRLLREGGKNGKRT